MPYQPLWVKKLWVSPPPFYSPHWKGCALPISSTYNTYNYTYRSDLGPTTLSVTSSYDITTSSTFGTLFLTFRYLKKHFIIQLSLIAYIWHTLTSLPPRNYFYPRLVFYIFAVLVLFKNGAFTFSLFSISPYAGLQKY